MKLIKPNQRLKLKFFDAIKDYKESEEWFYYYMYSEAVEDYDKYLKLLEDEAKGVDLAEERVPSTMYWLVDEDETEIRGIIRIRHRSIPVHGNIGYDVPPKMRFKGYGRELLRLGVLEARKMGLKEVRVTCAASNEGSKKIIEASGGEFLKSVMENFERFNEYTIRK